jgi:diguanylate cyclase (GGDEF)-like protein
VSAVSYGERLTRVPAVGLSAPARSFLYVTIAAAVGAAAVTTTVPLGDVRWGLVVTLLVGGAAAQFFASHTPGNQVFHTGTAFSIAAALVLPPELVVVVCAAQHVPEWLRQRYPWFVQSFNIANVVLSALVAWSMRAVFVRNGVHVTSAATTSAVLVALAAALAFVLVNHAMLARMLRLARGHNVTASGLFTVDSLIQDGVVGAVGVAIAFMLLNSWALAVVVALPLVLIQRALALPTLREQALTDHKTGLLNSRGIDQPARNEFARARRLGQALSVLVCDVDNLREINNTLGHLGGDAALEAVAAAFRAELRAYDIGARFGGDEFLVVLPETDEAEAVVVAGRIQAWLAANPIATADGPLEVGISIGVGSLQEGEQDLGTLLERADAAMYAEKHAGRNGFLTVG